MERIRIAEQHACVTDHVVMHVFSYPGYVTASELEHPASQLGYVPCPGIAARSEPSRYKGVKAMHVFAHREQVGAQCVSFPLQEKRILLGLSERTDILARPLELLVKHPDEGEHPLPSGTEVVDIYDSMDQALLILGAPGSGKTTLLLELARDLINRASVDPAHPIPVFRSDTLCMSFDFMMGGVDSVTEPLRVRAPRPRLPGSPFVFPRRGHRRQIA
jgi:hypothetical protein